MRRRGYWLVVRTKGRREGWAANNVEKLGFKTYLPLILVDERAESLFPNYLFVYTPNRQWRVLLSAFGVTSVVLQGGLPAKMEHIDIGRMREREDGDGFVRLPAALETNPRPRKGDAVRVKDGPFEGQEGVCEGVRGNDRAAVLLQFLGGKVPVLLRDDDLDIL